MNDVVEINSDNKKRIRKCQKSDNYFRVSNDCAEDKNLSSEGFSVICYLMKKPQDWKISNQDLSNRFGWSRNTVYKILTDLQKLGYLERQNYRNENGKIIDWDICIADEPIFHPPIKKGNVVDISPHPKFWDVDTKQPDPKKPLTGFLGSGDYIDTKKDFYKETTTTTTRARDPEAPASTEASVVVDLKFFTDFGYSEWDALKDLGIYGHEKLTEYVKYVQNAAGKPNNPVAYVRSLLSRKVSLEPKKTPSVASGEYAQMSFEETQKEIERMDNIKLSEPEVGRVHLDEIKKIVRDAT